MTARAFNAAVLAAFAVLLLVAFSVGRCSKPAVVEQLAPDTVFVTKVQIERSKPDTIVKFTERIVYRTLQPKSVQVAPGAAAPVVDAFVAAARDTVRLTDTLVVVPKLAEAERFNGDRLDIWMVGADRAAYREVFVNVCAPYEWRVTDGDVHLQSSRWCKAKAAGKALLFIGAGLALGKVFD